MEQELEIIGLVYPPAQQGSRRDVGHLCEEFAVHELAELLVSLKGLPVCIEHDTSELIGEVTSAELTHSNAVQVRAVVRASSESGRRAIADIRNRKMLGLSLSHEYNLFAKEGSPLKITLDRDGDWRAVAHKQGDSAVVKHMRELSVCRDPARSGCHIHGMSPVGVSVMSGLVNACRLSLSQQPNRSINTNNGRHDISDTPALQDIGGQVDHRLCLTLWNIVNKSANMETSTDVVPPTPQPVAPSGAEFVVPPIPQSITAVEPAALHEPVPIVPQPVPIVPPTPQSVVPPMDPAVLHSPGSLTAAEVMMTQAAGVRAALEEANQALLMRQHQMETLTARQLELETLHGAAVAESVAQADTLRAELRAIQQQNDEKAAVIGVHRQRELDAAQRGANDELAKLQATLRAYRASSDGHVMEDQYTGTDPVSVQKKVGHVVAEAIKTMNELVHNTHQAGMHAATAKRSHAQAMDALAPFGGEQRVASVGVVNASAARYGELEISKVARFANPETEQREQCRQLREFMDHHPEALLADVQKQLRLLQTPVLTGTVNASAGATWSVKSAEPASRPVALCAMHTQPLLFDSILKMNTGHIPGPAEVKLILDSVNVQRAGPYR